MTDPESLLGRIRVLEVSLRRVLDRLDALEKEGASPPPMPVAPPPPPPAVVAPVQATPSSSWVSELPDQSGLRSIVELGGKLKSASGHHWSRDRGRGLEDPGGGLADVAPIYRVGILFVLGVLSLGASYAYHKRGKEGV